MGRRRQRRYSPEFKAEAIRLVQTTDATVSAVARELGIATGTLQTWVEAARPRSREPLTEDERSELQRLRRETRHPRVSTRSSDRHPQAIGRDVGEEWRCGITIFAGW